MKRVLALLGVLSALPAGAQLPEEATNLQVFAEGTSVRELMGSMRGFTRALGVRCNHCHVGEDPNSLQGYDFASDEKETKRIARVMLKMTRAINATHLPETGREEVLAVGCDTCHRGLTRPQQMRDLMMTTAEEEGVEAAIALYRELREKHYGSAAYDFSAGPLDGLTESLAMQKQDLEGAMAVNSVNLEYNPNADYANYLRSRLLLRRGDRESAIETLEHAVEKNPDVEWLAKALEEVRNPPAAESEVDD